MLAEAYWVHDVEYERQIMRNGDRTLRIALYAKSSRRQNGLDGSLEGS